MATALLATTLLTTTLLATTLLTTTLLTTGPALAQSAAAATGHAEVSAKKHHRVVIQVSENDPKVMNLALNNAENLQRFYAQRGETVQIEIVAYGPGLAMVRADASPVKDRIAALGTGKAQHITVSGCENTLQNQSKQEGKPVSLLPEARLVPTGIARIVELQEQGWTYIRP
jgi:intracellular sulfur oxidation DsrE/DsrF family protein